MIDPAQELRNMATVSDRIEAVATDVMSGEEKYADVDPRTLADLLWILPRTGKPTSFLPRIRLDTESPLIADYVDAMAGNFCGRRIEELLRQSPVSEYKQEEGRSHA